MADERSRESREFLQGMKLLHEEMRDLKVDIRASMQKADEDRRRSDARFERLLTASDRRFEFLQEQVTENRKRSDALARGVIDIGKKILQKLDATNSKLDQANAKLDQANEKLDQTNTTLGIHGNALNDIKKALRTPRNGNGGNGHHAS